MDSTRGDSKTKALAMLEVIEFVKQIFLPIVPRTPHSNSKIKQLQRVVFVTYSKASQTARRFEILCLCVSSLVGDSACCAF
jgi:hypothetical protein